MKPHKHAAVIKAWADGAEIQYNCKSTGQWETIKGVPQWAENYEYRIKPLAVRFRNYLCQTDRKTWVGTYNAQSLMKQEELEKRSYFKGWIGDWQEIEVK